MEKVESWYKQVVFPYKVAFRSQLLGSKVLLPPFSLLHLFVCLFFFGLLDYLHDSWITAASDQGMSGEPGKR